MAHLELDQLKHSTLGSTRFHKIWQPFLLYFKIGRIPINTWESTPVCDGRVFVSIWFDKSDKKYLHNASQNASLY